jgi:predicted RND superfamily exporter protein
MMSFRVAKYIIFFMLLAFGALLFRVIPQLSFNNDYWLPNDNPYQRDLNTLEQEFQPGFGSVVVLSFPDAFFTNDNLAFFRQFKQQIESLDHVVKVNSPLDATVIMNADDTLRIETYDDALTNGHIASVNAYRSLFLKSPYHEKLLSNNEQWVALSVSIDKKNDGKDLHRRVSSVLEIKEILQSLPQYVNGFITGDAAIFYEMDTATQHNLVRLLPLAFGLLLLIAWIFLKQWRSVVIVIVPTLINLGLVPIFIVMLGHTITIVNITLFILALVITIADSIHILNYWERYVLNKSPHPIADTIRASWLPCFITSITTAVGFGSFVTSAIIPLNHYGIESFLVMLFAYVVVMTMVPFLLHLLPPHVRSKTDTLLFPTVVSKCAQLIANHYKKISILTIAFALVISQVLWFATTETSFISVFFNHEHPVQKQVALVDTHFTGSGRLDVLIKTNAPDTFKSIDAFNKLNTTINQSLSHPLLKSTVDMTIPVSMIHQSFNNNASPLPTTSDELEQELLFLEFSRGETKTDVLSAVVDFDYQNLRVEYITEQLNTQGIKDAIHFLNESFKSFDIGTVAITGGQFLSYVLGNYVMQSQFITIIITLSFVWLIFIGLYGLRLGSIGMIPNTIPLVLTLSLLPITNTPFDFATVLISSITLGLCVDDTIHWLHYYKLCKQHGDQNPAIKTTQAMFKPLFLTSIILGVGFGALSIANLVILKTFGLFTALSICLAFFADVILLPAILRWRKFM